MARDLDLCRDEDLMPSAGGDAQGGEEGSWTWRCLYCESEYDRNEVEERLLGEVEALVVQWTTQDLKCARCGALRVNEFMEHCTCSGEWRESVNRGEVMRRVGVYRNVARFYGLRMLGGVVDGILEGL
jgi:DNA polymerase epsilon subunit 1